MTDRYRTISKEGQAIIREKASRFVAFAFHAADEHAFKETVERIAHAHHSSRHVCHAFVAEPDGSLQRSNDAGEPSGTAGAPILRAILQSELTFTGVVVVRYFGGTLLGKAGLIRAYGDAARAAIAQASIIERVMRAAIDFTCDHGRFTWLKSDLLRMDGVLTSSSFGDRCSGTAEVPRGMLKEVLERWRAKGVDAEAAT